MTRVPAPAQATLGFIGGGNMAQAIVRGLLRSGHPASLVHVADPDPAVRPALVALDPEIHAGTDNGTVARTADVLVLAVKPQLMAAVLGALPRERPAGQLVFSVAAGVPLARLEALLGTPAAIVRAMPNQPALVGAGISALVATPGLDDARRALADYVAGAIGTAVWLPEEALMDAVTAVSGSGPAYFYLLMEHMERVAHELGLAPELAATLTRATALGAARTVIETGRAPAALRAGVTSPGGTTAAALAVFESAGLGATVSRALEAARDRSRELGGGTPGRQD